MELRHLRYFLEITHDLNMTKAAERLHISQPPLSRQIKQLEDELGADLFERSGGKLRLTPAGKFLIKKATIILGAVEETQIAMKRIGKKGHGWLNIGFVPSTIYGFLPEFLRHYRSVNPKIEISLSELMSQDQVVALKSGIIDIGLGRMIINDPEIKSEILFEEELMAVVPKNHPLAKKTVIEQKHLEHEPVILYPMRPRPNYCDHILALFSKQNIKLNVIQTVQELQTTLGLIASGVGISIVPVSVKKMRSEDVIYIPFKEKHMTSPVVMMYRDQEPQDELLQFIKRLRLLSGINRGRRKRTHK